MGALFFGEGDVGVVEEGGDVVFWAAGAEALEIDDDGGSIADEDVLALEVSVEEVAGLGGEAGKDVFKNGFLAERGDFVGGEGGVAVEELLEEVVLLPLVEGFVEGGLEALGVGFGEVGFREGVDFSDFEEGGFVEGAAFFPGVVAVVPEVDGAEVFDPHEAVLWDVGEDLGDGDVGAIEDASGVGEGEVVCTGGGVVHEDGDAGAIIFLNFEAPVGAIGAASRKGGGGDGGVCRDAREVGAGGGGDYFF